MNELFRLKIVSKRQVTVPQRLMDLIGLTQGDEIHVRVKDGKIIEALPVKVNAAMEMSAAAEARIQEVEAEMSAGNVQQTSVEELVGPALRPQQQPSVAWDLPHHLTGTWGLKPRRPVSFGAHAAAAHAGGTEGGWYTDLMDLGTLIPDPPTPPRNYQRADDLILDNVAASLAEAPIDVSQIEVHVENGRVTLDGVTAHRRDRIMAELISGNVLGVRDVQNSILVNPESQSPKLKHEG
jgi:antitoxin component of MazEF toxin-antitoxin module